MTNPADASIWQIIANTAWWVYPLFAYLIYVGYLATKPRVIAIRTLIRTPLILMGLTLAAMLTYLNFTLENSLLWITAFFLGTATGWLQFKVANVKAIKEEAKLALPGTFTVWILSLTFFIAKYYYHYELPLDLASLKTPSFQLGISAIYGMLTGLFTGKLLYAKRCLQAGPFVEGTLPQ